MGTVSVRMPDEEIEKLEKIAEREGKSRSAVLREFAEEKMEDEIEPNMEEIFGIISEEEGEGLKEGVEEVKSEATESFERSVEEKFK
ncbi:MAG: DUF6290 family protein [Candidatus Nanohalobium sp.]